MGFEKIRWIEDRATYIRAKFVEGVDGANLTAIDMTAATAKARIRAWHPPIGNGTSSAYILNSEMTKQNGTTAIFDIYATITTSASIPSEACFELVIVDEAVGSQPTPTTFRERVMHSWSRIIEQSIQP